MDMTCSKCAAPVDETTTEPITVGGWYSTTDGGSARIAWGAGVPRTVEARCGPCGIPTAAEVEARLAREDEERLAAALGD